LKKNSVIAVIVGALVIAGVSWIGFGSDNSSENSSEKVEELTIYSGRSEEFIAPFFARWEKESGIKLNIRYGDSAELAAQILEEGKNSPADLFLSQDAGSLGALSVAGLLSKLPDSVGSEIESQYIGEDRAWVGVTGRARVFAYRPGAVDPLPTSVAELTSAKFKDRVGIAPSNSSFQAFVTALISKKGEKFSEKWLAGMKANGAKIYLKNSEIVEAIDKGEIDLGLVNHYYVWEVSEALGREINAEISFFTPGDIGNLINVSGVGILGTSKKESAAIELINFLTAKPSQIAFVEDTHEYSLISGVKAPEGLSKLEDIGAPEVDLGDLEKVQRTQDLLTKVGLL
jgi:iron(III) transport system substrate-binding protein